MVSTILCRKLISLFASPLKCCDILKAIFLIYQTLLLLILIHQFVNLITIRLQYDTESSYTDIISKQNKNHEVFYYTFTVPSERFKIVFSLVYKPTPKCVSCYQKSRFVIKLISFAFRSASSVCCLLKHIEIIL